MSKNKIFSEASIGTLVAIMGTNSNNTYWTNTKKANGIEELRHRELQDTDMIRLLPR